jgi:hypothetical protein
MPAGIVQVPPDSTGKRVQTFENTIGGQAVQAQGVVAVDADGAEKLLALDGADITSPSAMPAGGSGIRGWLSAIYTKLMGSIAVTGTFWPATQPVSGTFFQATQPVSGTFWQATQPVSGPLTNTELRAAPVPVSGTFFQATQPVSGTFWQATQPVSVASLPLPTGAATETTLTATNTSLGTDGAAAPVIAGTGVRGWLRAIFDKLSASIAVTGTFWQATQPVSLATNTPDVTDRAGRVLGVVTGPLTDVQLRAAAVPTDPSDRAARALGVVSMTAALPAGTNRVGAVRLVDSADADLTTTKGVQPARVIGVQELIDSGRTTFGAATVIAGVTAVTTEALLSMVPVRAGVAGAAATSIAVTAGKRMRIQAITIGFISTAAAVLSMRFALRMNPAGAVTATSPILWIFPLSSGAALAQAGNQMTIPVPDGFEISGADQIGLTQVGSVATGTVWASIQGFEY